MNGKDTVRRVAIGSDVASTAQKMTLIRFLELRGYSVIDVGFAKDERPGFVETAVAVCRSVSGGECERGIVLDADGIGSAMVANKLKGIRAALCYDLRTAINSREHLNANVLTLGGPVHGIDDLCEIAGTWLESRFAGGGYLESVNRISRLERGGTL